MEIVHEFEEGLLSDKNITDHVYSDKNITLLDLFTAFTY